MARRDAAMYRKVVVRHRRSEDILELYIALDENAVGGELRRLRGSTIFIVWAGILERNVAS